RARRADRAGGGRLCARHGARVRDALRWLGRVAACARLGRTGGDRGPRGAPPARVLRPHVPPPRDGALAFPPRPPRRARSPWLRARRSHALRWVLVVFAAIQVEYALQTLVWM